MSPKSVSKPKSHGKSNKSARKCKLAPKRYIVLKCAKISSKKPITKQGKVLKMKCSSARAAAKYAIAMHKKNGKKIEKVYLYRRGNVVKFAITFKVSKKTGKNVAVAKMVKKMPIKKTKKTKPCRKCPKGSRKSKSGKTCKTSKLALARKTKAAKKAKMAAKAAAKKASSAKKTVLKAKKSLSKHNKGTIAHSKAVKSAQKAKTVAKTALKSARKAKTVSTKKASELKSFQKSMPKA